MTSRSALLALALAFFAVEPASAQPPPSPELNELTHQIAERVRHLGEDVATDLGRTPGGNHLLEDTRELAQALDEFHDTLHQRRDPLALRRAYAGIDGSWHHLRGLLSQPGNSSPAVDRAAARVDELDTRLHQALGLNAPPQGFYGASPAPAGPPETMRLAHALVQRADLLLNTARGARGNDPNPAGLQEEAANLSRAAVGFHDAVEQSPAPEVAAQAFAPVDAIADRVERYVTGNPVAPPVLAAWQAFAAVEVLIHQNLGINAPQPSVPLNVGPPAGGGPSPVLAVADQISAESATFVQIFSDQGGRVPEAPFIMADAQRFQAAAANFRDDVARGLSPGQLAIEFRDVDANWQRLARRVNRVARGRIGPNIAEVQKLGALCEQVHQALGMPGFAPEWNGPAFAP